MVGILFNFAVMKLTDIKPNPNNPRIIKDANFKKLCKSIEEFPKMMALRPIVVDEDGMVLGGNMRLKALQHLGFKEIPDEWVKKASTLTDEEKQRFIIADNVSGGEWDVGALAEGWDKEQLADWGLEIEWPVDIRTAEEDNYEIPDEIETDIVIGDLFEIGEHRLLCGDSTQTDAFEKLMQGELADMVVTDPPYNVAYEGATKEKLTIKNDSMGNDDFYKFLYDFYSALTTAVKKGGSIYVWHASSEIINFAKAMVDAGWLLKQQLIWVKNSMVMGRQDYQWKHEPCLYGWKEGAAHYFTPDRTKTTVIDDQIDLKKLSKDSMLKLLQEIYSDKTKTTVLYCDKPYRSAEHPTMKPILLIAPLIENSSKRGWTVLDPFIGSGSTMVAAHQLNRKCYGMELDSKYCQVIIDRMRKLDPTLTIKKNGQFITFNEAIDAYEKV